MIALGLLLVIIGAAIAAVVVSRSNHPAEGVGPDPAAMRPTTFLSTQPSLFAVPEEPNAGVDIGTAPDVAPLHRSVPVFAEALGYIGGVLVVVALGVIVNEYWSDLGVAGRLAISAGAAGGLFGLGAIITVERDVALRRLRAFLWFASAAATGLLAGVVAVDIVDTGSWQTITMVVSGAFAAQCGLLWRNRFRPLQQVGFTVGFAVFLGAVVGEFLDDGPIGVALWVFGAACVVGGLRRVIVDPTIAEIAGAAIAYAGCAFIISEWMGFGEMLAVTTAWALVAPAVVRGITAERNEQILFGVIGAIALVMTVPAAIGYYAFEAGIATGVVVWIVGALSITVGVRAMVRLPLLAQLFGAATLLIGAAVCAAQNVGFAPIFGLVTAIGLIVLGTRPGLAIMSLFGSLGLLINVPWLISHFFPGRGRAPFLILVSGLLIMGVAVLLARSGGRIREEVSRPNHRQMRHAA